MSTAPTEHIRNHAAFIWSVADLLRGDYKQSEYGRVILPMVVLRRLDCVLEPTKDRVLETAAKLAGKVENVHPLLEQASEMRGVYNTSPLTMTRLLDDPPNIADNLRSYLLAFSPAARDVLEKFDLPGQISRLDNADLLYLVVSKFCAIDLHAGIRGSRRTSISATLAKVAASTRPQRGVNAATSTSGPRVSAAIASSFEKLGRMDVIAIQGQDYLLVGVGGGQAVHLALPGSSDAEQDRVPTLCGRVWAGDVDGQLAPNCGRCLMSIDRLFPAPTPDTRIDLVASLVVDAMRRHGYAEIVGVPGDQLHALRRTIRRQIKSALGFKSNTHVTSGRLFVMSDEAYAPHAERHLKDAAVAMNTFLTGEEAPPIDDTEWRFHWSAWGTA